MGGARDGRKRGKGTGFVDAGVSPFLIFVICSVFFVFLFLFTFFLLIFINRRTSVFLCPPHLNFILIHLHQMRMAVLMHLGY